MPSSTNSSCSFVDVVLAARQLRFSSDGSNEPLNCPQIHSVHTVKRHSPSGLSQDLMTNVSSSILQNYLQLQVHETVTFGTFGSIQWNISCMWTSCVVLTSDGMTHLSSSFLHQWSYVFVFIYERSLMLSCNNTWTVRRTRSPNMTWTQHDSGSPSAWWIAFH